MNPTVDKSVILRRITEKVERADAQVGRLPLPAGLMVPRVTRTTEQHERLILYMVERYGSAVSIELLKRAANAN